MNEIIKIENEIYPLTVVSDRYGGTYSGGNFTAWNLDFDEIPNGINGNDVSCHEFWLDNEIPVGRGSTIHEAIYDLYIHLLYKKGNDSEDDFEENENNF
jgi:hypothetical protein